MIRRLAASVLHNYTYYTPSHPGRGLLGKLAHRLQPQGFPAEVAPGVRFSIRLNSPEDYLYWMGRYETQGEVRCFRSPPKPGMTVFIGTVAVKILFERIVGYGYRAFHVKGGAVIPVAELQPHLYTSLEPFSNYILTPA